MTVLAMRASGFLGSHVTRRPVARGDDVRVLLRTTSDTRGIDGLSVDRIRRLAEFGDEHPGLLPEAANSAGFVERMLADVGRIAAAEDTVIAWLRDTGAHSALCHWNANVDNAWF